MITFRHFWDGFDPRVGFFSELHDLFDLPIDCEIELESVFRPKRQSAFSRLRREQLQNVPRLGRRRIWYSGENIRPPFQQGFDGFLSYDQDDFGGENAYLPLVYISSLSKLGDGSGRVSGVREHNDLLKQRPPLANLPANFMCAFINNPEPTRLRAIEAFSKLGQVDVFGSLSGKIVQSKDDVAKEYKYILCFENDLYPGYVTEKLFEGYLCGAVPIYWGDLGDEKHINRNSFLNLYDFSSLSEFVDKVRWTGEDEWHEVRSQAFYNSLPSLAQVRSVLLGPNLKRTTN